MIAFWFVAAAWKICEGTVGHRQRKSRAGSWENRLQNDPGRHRWFNGAHRRWRPGGRDRRGVSGFKSRSVIDPIGRVLVTSKLVDFGKGADGRAALVRESLTTAPS